jgi:hypothetical protein
LICKFWFKEGLKCFDQFKCNPSVENDDFEGLEENFSFCLLDVSFELCKFLKIMISCVDFNDKWSSIYENTLINSGIVRWGEIQ